MLDAGLNAVTPEFGLPVALEHPRLEVVKLSEEHAVAHLEGPARRLKPGDRVELVPMHGCTTINLHGTFHCVQDGQVVARWPIAASAFTR